MWKQALASLSDDQFDAVFRLCIDRCMKGNPWPPELCDLIAALSGEMVKHNPFGLDPDEMLNDFMAYCATRMNYICAELYPFKHPVQYWIFTKLRSKMYDLRLTETECEKRLLKMLTQWSEKVRNGQLIPKPVLGIEHKDKPRPAWMDMVENSKRRTL